MAQECKDCRFWDRPAGAPTAKGLCRRYAPRPGSRVPWPETDQNDWCGEWQTKEDTKREE